MSYILNNKQQKRVVAESGRGITPAMAWNICLNTVILSKGQVQTMQGLDIIVLEDSLS